MMRTFLLPCALVFGLSLGAEAGPEKDLKVGADAPAFKIKDTAGKEIDLAALTEKGPVLVRLTCGCLGCDLELPYYQALHDAYKGQGLTSIAIFAEPDAKFAEYVKTKELNMLYALDPKRESWKVFGTRTMPSNFLIEKGGKVVAISKGCNPDGLKAMTLSGETAKLVDAETVDVTAGIEPGSERKKRRKKNRKK
jgi:peroxiredoxin